jgi:hypothetical protein
MKNRVIFLSMLFLLLSLSFSENLSAQRRNKAPLIRLGLRTGFNMSDLTSAKGLDVYNGLAYYDEQLNYIGFTDTKPFKFGFNVGVTAQAQLNDYFFLQGSFIYTTKGYKLNTQNVDINAKADYLQIPIDLMYKYELNDDWRLVASLGAFFGVGIYGFTDFEDHYGEKDNPRLQHQTLREPFRNEETGIHSLICFDPTVHGATYWKDRNDTFATDGTWQIDGGFQIGLGFEWKSFQFLAQYQYSFTPLYDYEKKFNGRYEAKGYDDIATSFEFLNQPVPSSPRQQLITFTISYFFDNWNHGIRW